MNDDYGKSSGNDYFNSVDSYGNVNGTNGLSTPDSYNNDYNGSYGNGGMNGSNMNGGYDFNQQPSYMGETKFCTKCGAKIAKDAVICPNCGCATEMAKQEGSALSICALIFSILGGWLGLVLSIAGLITNKNAKNRRRCKIALGISIAWIVLYILLKVL